MKKTIFVFYCFSCLGCGFAQQVENDFGICYDEGRQTFSFSHRVVKHFRRTPHDVLRWEGEGPVTITADSIRRLNRYYYYLSYTEGSDEKRLAVRCVVYRRSENGSYWAFLDGMDTDDAGLRYFFGAAASIHTVGKVLVLSDGRLGADDVLFYYGRTLALTDGAIHPEYVQEISPDEYLVMSRGFSIFAGHPVFFLCSIDGGVRIAPLHLARRAWNGYVCGTRVDKSGVCFGLYSLRGGRDIPLDDVDLPVEEAYFFNDSEILLILVTGEQRWLSSDGTVLSVRGRYVRQRNVMLAYEENRLVAVLAPDGSRLWSGDIPVGSIDAVDLDQDLARETEAFVLHSQGKDILIDCVSGQVYEATEIRHVGLGFFRCSVDGIVTWVTL